ncbi:hypothetical protein [Deinococcus ruber]|uniref:Uncharacterized protein n=1 Tax=Deinococcus ruber TaxID=1848197 RepID=A0A918KVV3_9DEIO|nr:hypothetical protein [Deinococcus ruber]GGR36487.1 hypothetical protein GCM10008957_52690 [Deinococcus ruber]
MAAQAGTLSHQLLDLQISTEGHVGALRDAILSRNDGLTCTLALRLVAIFPGHPEAVQLRQLIEHHASRS